jgi:hypothetical protein
MSAHALCDHCATLKRLTSSGVLVLHFLKVPNGSATWTAPASSAKPAPAPAGHRGRSSGKRPWRRRRLTSWGD